MSALEKFEYDGEVYYVYRTIRDDGPDFDIIRSWTGEFVGFVVRNVDEEAREDRYAPMPEGDVLPRGFFKVFGLEDGFVLDRDAAIRMTVYIYETRKENR